MAKPLSSSSANCLSTFILPHCLAQDASGPSYLSQHRRRRKLKSSSSVAPSSGLLVLLASVASASTASGSPAPPTFLCPSVNVDGACDLNLQPSSSTLPSITPSPSDPSALLTNPGRHLPDRFDRDTDGMWRRVPSYTLYGSTVSVECDDGCMQPTEVASPTGEPIQEGAVDSNSTANATSSYDIRNSLPPGWKPADKPYESRTPLILSLSLVLALFICFFIFGCLFWRGSVKKKHRNNDIEAKARRQLGENDTRDLVDKEVKAKQKVWARATARWRENARYSARQRRGKRLGSRLSNGHLSNVSIDRSRSRLGDSHSFRSQRNSRRSSMVSIPDDLHQEELTDVSASTSREQTVESLPPPSSPSSPPAYQHRGRSKTVHTILGNEIFEQSSSDLLPGGSRGRPHSLTPTTSECMDDLRDGESPEPVFLHAAHVATDDKTLLARLAEFASSPPPDAFGAVGTAGERVSAPSLDDEDLVSNFASTGGQVPHSSNYLPTPMFPPPPSKERLAAAERYVYPFSLDDLDTLEVEAVPSAPPFQEDSSENLSGPHSLPSAPPLLDTDEFPQSVRGGTLDWYQISGHADPPEEAALGQNHDRIRADSTVIGPSSFSSRLTPPLITDNIALPGYQP